MTPIETELEKFEFVSAVTTWDRLSDVNKVLLLELPIHQDLYTGIRPKTARDLEFKELCDLGLVVTGNTQQTRAYVREDERRADYYWAQSIMLTFFGGIVARYGRAKTIVDRATALGAVA